MSKKINWSFLKRKRTWLLLPLFLIVLLFAFLAWVVGTNSGSRWVLSTALDEIGGKISNLEGTIWSGLKLQSLQINMDSINLIAKDVDLQVEWPDLLGAKLHVDHMDVSELALQLFPVVSPDEEDEDDGPIELPIDIQVDRLTLQTFSLLLENGEKLPVDLSAFDLRDLQLSEKGTQADLRNLQVDNADITTVIKGRLFIEQLGDPWPMDLDLNAAVTGHNTTSFACIDSLSQKLSALPLPVRCELDNTLTVKGNLNDLKVLLNGHGQGATLKGDVNIDLSSPLVLKNADIKLNHKDMDLSLNVKTEAGNDGQSVLNGNLNVLNLPLNRFADDSRLSSNFDVSVASELSGDIDSVALKGNINDDTQVNGQSVGGLIDLAMDLKGMQQAAGPDHLAYTDLTKLKLRKGLMDLHFGDNTVKADGTWGEPDSKWTLDANITDLSQLDPSSDHDKLKVSLEAQGYMPEHTLISNVEYSPVKESKQIGEAPVSLKTESHGALTYEKGLLNWNGQIKDVDFKHAGIELKQNNPLDLSFKEGRLPTLNDLRLGAAEFSLRMPGGEVGQIRHEQTELSRNRLKTSGEFSNLSLDAELFKRLGVVLDGKQGPAADSAVSYDGSWNIDEAKGKILELVLDRKKGDAMLPVKGFPLDLDKLNLNAGTDPRNTRLTHVTAKGSGQKSSLDMALALDDEFALALKSGHLNLEMPQNSAITAEFKDVPIDDQPGLSNWQADISTKGLDLAALSLGAVPKSSLDTSTTLKAELLRGSEIRKLTSGIEVNQGSRWMDQDMQGHIRANLNLRDVLPLPLAVQSPLFTAQTKPENIRLDDSDIDLTIGQNRLAGGGQWGKPDDHFKFSANLPRLAQFDKSLSGKANLGLDLQGDIATHHIKLNADYDPQTATAGRQPAMVRLDLQGKMDQLDQGGFDWAGTLSDTALSYAGTSIEFGKPLQAEVSVPQDGDLSWKVGETDINLIYPDQRQATIHHVASQSKDGRMSSSGNLKNLILSKPILTYFEQVADSFSTDQAITKPGKLPADRELALDADWDIKKGQAIQGSLNIQRQGASGVWPLDLPVPINFDNLSVSIQPQKRDDKATAAPGPDKLTIEARGEGKNSELSADVLINLLNPILADSAMVHLSLPDNSLLNVFFRSQNKPFTKDGVDKVLASVNQRRDVAAGSQNANAFADVDENSTADAGALSLSDINVLGALQTRGIPLDKVSGGAVPPGNIDANLAFNGNLADEALDQLIIKGNIAEGSRWNRNPLSGNIDLFVKQSSDNSQNSTLPTFYVLPKADIDLRLGGNRINSKGGFGEQNDHLKLNVNAPKLSDFWPDLPGSVKSDINLDGSIAKHKLNLDVDFRQGNSNEIGEAPVKAKIALEGGWNKVFGNADGWKGRIQDIQVDHAGFGLKQSKPLDLAFALEGKNGQPQWDAGASQMQITLPGNYQLTLEQGGSKGEDGKWSTQGKIPSIVLSDAFFNAIDQISQAEEKNKSGAKGQVVVNQGKAPKVAPLTLALDWNFNFDKQLKGGLNLKRTSGDFLMPAATPFALGLNQLDLNVTSQPQGGASALNAKLAVNTAKRGNLSADVSTRMNGLAFDPQKETINAKVKGRIDDIAWLSAFTDDMLELGGVINLDVNAQVKGDNITSNGGVTGRNLKIVEVENGIRLLNGTMDIGLNGDQVSINKLHFPSVFRVIPTEWRTRQWIKENPTAQKGALDVTGRWDLKNQNGNVAVVLDHYPVVQRSDRFVMMSGKVTTEASLPKVKVRGKIVADAGWASVDIQGGAPTLDSDVVIIDKNQKEEEPEASPMDLDMRFTVDLGPRFYIVGYGLDSGLAGGITLIQKDQRLTAEGGFHTRGGAVEAYGQRLQIARGGISFQGNIMNPVLDIEAVRRGLDVEAGVKVTGTARRPKIELISYPDVSDVEKLSWLIMGRGPDSSGGDLAMLFSVGSSFVGGGEPLYKKFGIDDIGIHSGDIGKTSTVLPAKTVADSTQYAGAKDVENQFISVGKRLSKQTWAEINQALSGTGTIGKFSYNLTQYIDSNLKIGTVTGLELMYRRYFKD